MGISGLLRLLSPAFDKNSHIREFRGQTVAIDGHSWLHKGTYACALELAIGQPTSAYVGYFYSRIKLLKAFGVTPLVVFDGDKAPGKAETKESRTRSRGENKTQGLKLWEEANRLPRGSSQRERKTQEALKCLQRAINVSAEMVRGVIEMLQREGIQFLVAPYEADAQLAYLGRTNRVAAIISEDSDVILYSVTAKSTVPIFYKMDANGMGQKFDWDALATSNGKGGKSPTFIENILKYMTDGKEEAERLFIQMCILSGCDYLESLPGIGLMTAQKLVLQFRTVPSDQRIDHIVAHLSNARGKQKKEIPEDYAVCFKKSEALFFYHRIFDLEKQRCDTLNPVSELHEMDIEERRSCDTTFQDVELNPDSKRQEKGDASVLSVSAHQGDSVHNTEVMNSFPSPEPATVDTKLNKGKFIPIRVPSTKSAPTYKGRSDESLAQLPCLHQQGEKLYQEEDEDEASVDKSTEKAEMLPPFETKASLLSTSLRNGCDGDGDAAKVCLEADAIEESDDEDHEKENVPGLTSRRLTFITDAAAADPAPNHTTRRRNESTTYSSVVLGRKNQRLRRTCSSPLPLLHYLGPDIDQDVVRGIAGGLLHPVTKEKLQVCTLVQKSDQMRREQWARACQTQKQEQRQRGAFRQKGHGQRVNTLPAHSSTQEKEGRRFPLAGTQHRGQYQASGGSLKRQRTQGGPLTVIWASLRTNLNYSASGAQKLTSGQSSDSFPSPSSTCSLSLSSSSPSTPSAVHAPASPTSSSLTSSSSLANAVKTTSSKSSASLLLQYQQRLNQVLDRPRSHTRNEIQESSPKKLSLMQALSAASPDSLTITSVSSQPRTKTDRLPLSLGWSLPNTEFSPSTSSSRTSAREERSSDSLKRGDSNEQQIFTTVEQRTKSSELSAANSERERPGSELSTTEAKQGELGRCILAPREQSFDSAGQKGLEETSLQSPRKQEPPAHLFTPEPVCLRAAKVEPQVKTFVKSVFTRRKKHEKSSNRRLQTAATKTQSMFKFLRNGIAKR